MKKNGKIRNKRRRNKKNIPLWLSIILSLLFCILFGNYLANRQVYVTTYEMEDEKIPQSFDDYRIVQVTDVHSIRSIEQADMLFETIASQNPDAVVITGDLVDSTYYGDENNAKKAGERDEIPGSDTVDFVKRLTEHYYVYYVYGNHEMVLLDDVDNNPFKLAMEDIGVVFLNNEGVRISKGDESIYMLGIQDPATLYKDYNYKECKTHTDRINAMMQKVMALTEEKEYTVLLSHRPEYFQEYVRYDVDLVITGHAHGGQIRIPGVGGLYAPGQGWFPIYTDGIFSDKETDMIVGRGIGDSTWIPRIFNPPEINTIILKTKDA